jgi:hypothetical protein
MSALLALIDPTVMALANTNFVVAAGSVELVGKIREFIAPLFLLAIGIAAMSFLFQRQVTQFLQFAALAVGVAVFFYVPGIVETVARFIASAF